MLTKKKYTRSRALLVAVSLLAVMLAFLLPGCQSEVEPELPKQEQSNSDSTGGEDTGNTGSNADTKPETCTHNSSEGDEQTCKGYQCTACGIWYGDKNPENHASTDFTYTDNGDGTTHGKKHQCCGAEGQAEPHEVAQPKYKWSTDYSTCTAEGSCTLCKGAVTEKAVRDADTEAGITARFKTSGFEKQTITKVILTETIKDYLMSDYVQTVGWNNDNERNLTGSSSAIGTPDAGKTTWVDGDQILVSLESKVYGRQAATLTFTDGEWNPSLSEPLYYLQEESPAVTACYAPGHEIKDDKSIAPKDTCPLGTSEYISFYASIHDGQLSIEMESVHISYSRLRIAATPKQTLNVTVTAFMPVGVEEEGEHTYTLTADDKGNAYLYGIFVHNATITVQSGGETPTTYTFVGYGENNSESRKSYALSAMQSSATE